MSAKLSHYWVDYLSAKGMPRQTCEGCRHVITTPAIACQLVAPPIFLAGWCMRWEKKPVPELAEKVLDQSPHA